MSPADLDALWARVAHVAQERVDVVEAAHIALRDGAGDVAERRAAARLECHKLVGSLDSYGRTGGSALALRAAAIIAADVPDLEELGQVVAGLRAAVAGADGST